MSDSANIVVINHHDGSSVSLYTHMEWKNTPKILQDALKRRARWDDPFYLARIIFCAMVKGDEDGVMGYSISATRLLSEGRDIFVNTKDQTIEFLGRKWSFEEYIELEKPNKLLRSIWLKD